MTFGKILAIVALMLSLSMPPALAGMMRSRTIQQSDYGNHWVFTVPAGILYCMTAKESETMVAFATADAAYALNQAAKNSGYPDIDPILKSPARRLPFLGGRKSEPEADIRLFVAQGIRLCGG